MKFIQNGKFHELQIELMEPCDSVETFIYGVRYKNPKFLIINDQKPYVFEKNFTDGGLYYEALGYLFENYQYEESLITLGIFKDLEKAKEFLINYYKDKPIRFYK